MGEFNSIQVQMEGNQVVPFDYYQIGQMLEELPFQVVRIPIHRNCYYFLGKKYNPYLEVELHSSLEGNPYQVDRKDQSYSFDHNPLVDHIRPLGLQFDLHSSFEDLPYQVDRKDQSYSFDHNPLVVRIRPFEDFDRSLEYFRNQEFHRLVVE